MTGQYGLPTFQNFHLGKKKKYFALQINTLCFDVFLSLSLLFFHITQYVPLSLDLFDSSLFFFRRRVER